MTDGASARTARYSAFISYSHQDSAFARRLHKQLETYRLPRRVARKGAPGAAASRRLRPIFRDRVSQRAAADITEVVRVAIADSSHLIVICSPNSATSTWVGREVSLFRELHQGGVVLAALCEGTAPDAFHPTLRAEGPDGRERMPLAADFRREGDGARLALLKLVAVLADVQLEDLVQRDAQRRVRQVSAISIGALLGMTVAGLLASAAIRARAAAEQERTRSERVIEFMLTDLRGRLKGVGRLDLLNVVNQGALRYYRGQDLAHLPDAALEQRAKLLLAIGEDDEKRGHFTAARAQFEEARRTTGELLRAQPDDLSRVFAHAQSEYWLGFIRWRLGDDEGAEVGFKAYSALARRLARTAPNNPDWLLEAGDADSNLGMFTLRRSADTDGANALFGAALADFKDAARRRPADREIQNQVADGYGWLGAVELLRGDYKRAFDYRMADRRILEALLAGDPRDSEAQTDMVSNDLALARIAAASGQLASAVNQLREGHDAAIALARSDPENADIAREARVIELFEVRTWLMMPVKQRPPSKLIAATIGDCATERAKANNEEVASFCTILRARRLAEGGDHRGAARLLKLTGVMTAGRRDALSERWLINFKDETRYFIVK